MAEKQVKRETHPSLKDVDKWRPPTMENMKMVDASQVKAPKALAKAAANVTMVVTNAKLDEMASIGNLGIVASDIDKFDGGAIFRLVNMTNMDYKLDVKVPLNESRTVFESTSQKYYKITATEALIGYAMSSSSISYTVEEMASGTATNPSGVQLHKGEVFTFSSSDAPSIGVSLSDVDRITGDAMFMFFNSSTGRYLTEAKVKRGETKTINAGGASFGISLNEAAAGVRMSNIFADFDIGSMSASTQRSDVAILQKDESVHLTSGDRIALHDITLDGTAMMGIITNENYSQQADLNIKVGSSKTITLGDGTKATVEVSEVGLGYTLSTIYAALKITGASAYSTFFADESLTLSNGYKVMLKDITSSGASLEIQNSSGTRIGTLSAVKENSRMTISLGGGKTAELAIGEIATGYAMGSKWVELAEILPSEVTAVKAGAKAQKLAGAKLFSEGGVSKIEGDVKFVNAAGREITRRIEKGQNLKNLSLAPGVYIARYGKMAQPLEITK